MYSNTINITFTDLLQYWTDLQCQRINWNKFRSLFQPSCLPLSLIFLQLMYLPFIFVICPLFFFKSIFFSTKISKHTLHHSNPDVISKTSSIPTNSCLKIVRFKIEYLKTTSFLTHTVKSGSEMRNGKGIIGAQWI